MHRAGVHISVVGELKELLPNQFILPSLKNTLLFSLVRSEIIQMYGGYPL